MPKEIHIVDQIPLTAVGKIFKPALRWDATRRIYEWELEKLGQLVESVQVQVGEDKVHGTLASIQIKAAPNTEQDEIKKRITEILARYTIHWEVMFEK